MSAADVALTVPPYLPAWRHERPERARPGVPERRGRMDAAPERPGPVDAVPERPGPVDAVPERHARVNAAADAAGPHGPEPAGREAPGA